MLKEESRLYYWNLIHYGHLLGNKIIRDICIEYDNISNKNLKYLVQNIFESIQDYRVILKCVYEDGIAQSEFIFRHLMEVTAILKYIDADENLIAKYGKYFEEKYDNMQKTINSWDPITYKYHYFKTDDFKWTGIKNCKMHDLIEATNLGPLMFQRIRSNSFIHGSFTSFHINTACNEYFWNDMIYLSSKMFYYIVIELAKITNLNPINRYKISFEKFLYSIKQIEDE